MKARIFPHYNLLLFKFTILNTCLPIPILNFLCIFIAAQSPVSHTFSPEEEMKSKPEAKLHLRCLTVQGQALESEKFNTHIKMGIYFFININYKLKMFYIVPSPM